MREIEIRGRLERRLLTISLSATLTIALFGVTFGVLAGSFSILFDGFYSLVDAAMAALALRVAQLILKDALRRDENAPGKVRYQYGFWHLEPMVLVMNSIMLMMATLYALVSAVLMLLEGGNPLELGWAIAYAAVVVTICAVVAWQLRRANRRLESDLVALDVKSWVMSGSITFGILVGFIIGWAIGGTRWAWLQPYMDPAILALVCLIVLPMPLPDLREAMAGVLRIAPPDLDEHVTRVAMAAVAQHGFDDAYTYVARVGRATLIEIHFITRPGWKLDSVAALDAIRQKVSDDLGEEGPDRWLTISFTEDAEWAF